MRSSTAIIADLALQHGGVRAAARAAGLPVASVSTALARMEAAVGSPLARRSEDGLSLTVAGGPQAAAIARVAQLARGVHGLDPVCTSIPARPVSFAALFRLGQVLRAGSIRRAALQMQLSQPQLTRQIALLETSLGAPLLIRGRAGIVPTPEGERLAGLVDLLEAEWHCLTGGAEPLHRQAARSFALGAVVPAGPDGEVAGLLGRIVEAVAIHGQMRLTVAAAIAEDLLAGLDSGRFDAVIVDSGHVGPSCRQRRLLTSGAVMVGPGLPAHHDDREGLRCALEGTPLVLQSPRSGLRQCAEAFLDRAAGADWRRLANVIEVDSLPVILHMARTGRALTVLPSTSTRSGFDTIPMVTLPPSCDLSYWLTWRERPKGRRLATAIKEALAAPDPAGAATLDRFIAQINVAPTM